MRIMQPNELVPAYARIGKSTRDIEEALGRPEYDGLPPEVWDAVGVKDKTLHAISYNVPYEGPSSPLIMFFFKEDRLTQIYWSFF